MFFVALTGIASAGESEEVLTLKRNFAKERVARITVELQLVQRQYKEAQEEVISLNKQIADYDKQLATMRETNKKK